MASRSPRRSAANKQKLMNTRHGVIPKPRVRKRKKRKKR